MVKMVRVRIGRLRIKLLKSLNPLWNLYLAKTKDLELTKIQDAQRILNPRNNISLLASSKGPRQFSAKASLTNNRL
jgi:hypothetical protein